MLSHADTALVRLYYESFGLAPAEIAAATGRSKPVVESLIKELGLVAPDAKKLAEDKKQALLSRNLDKQLALEPYYARAEVLILGRLIDVVEALDPAAPGTSAELTACARAYKDLQASSLTGKFDTPGDATGVTVQILNQL